ncbi:MAG: hypothetical protein WBF83_03440 [Moheibacter sp.]
MMILVIGDKRYIGRHFKTIENHFGDDLKYMPEYVPNQLVASSPDLVIVPDEHWCELGNIVSYCNENGILTLQMMDGILEWRRTWDYTREGKIIGEGANPLNQPAFADKIACLGFKDFRILESWGNIGKCEITGMPRLKHIMNLRNDFSHLSQKKNRLLVCTAKTPAFTDKQAEKTIRSLTDLKEYFSKRNDIEIIWRITGDYSKLIGVENSLNDLTGKEIHEIIQQVDAVITTPSTSILEAMTLKVPVATLDYHNQPHYFETAWSISAQTHIEETVDELMNPPVTKLEYQDFLYKEQLYSIDDPNSRLIRLIEEMIKFKGKKQELPQSILDNSYLGTLTLKSDMKVYYPGLDWVDKMDLKKLKLELSAARGTIKEVENKNDKLQKRLNSIPFYNFVKSVKNRFK